jgi:hypothetical protein
VDLGVLSMTQRDQSMMERALDSVVLACVSAALQLAVFLLKAVRSRKPDTPASVAE